MLQFRSNLQAKTKLKLQWKILYQCSVPGSRNSYFPPFSEMTTQLAESKLVLPVIFCSGIRQTVGEFVISDFFPFFPSPYAAIPLSFLLLVIELTQSCSWGSPCSEIFMQMLISISSLYRVHGDYWAPEVHLAPLDNLYVGCVLYLQLLEEK